MATIRDLKLTDALDVAVEDGDLVLIEDADVVAQQLRIRLSRLVGEWYLDATSGVDYLGEVFPKGSPREAAIREAIVTTPYVLALAKFEVTYAASTRHLAIEFEAATSFGTITVQVEVP